MPFEINLNELYNRIYVHASENLGYNWDQIQTQSTDKVLNYQIDNNDAHFIKYFNQEDLQIPFKNWQKQESDNQEKLKFLVNGKTILISNRPQNNGELRGEKFLNFIKNHENFSLNDIIQKRSTIVSIQAMQTLKMDYSDCEETTSLIQEAINETVEEMYNSPEIKVKFSDIANYVTDLIFEKLKKKFNQIEEIELIEVETTPPLLKNIVRYLEDIDEFNSDNFKILNESQALQESILRLKGLGEFTQADWNLLKNNSNLQKSLIEVSNTGEFTQADWSPLKNDSSLQTVVVERSENKDYQKSQASLIEFQKYANDSINKNKKSSAESYIKNHQMASKAYLLDDKENYDNCMNSAKNDIKSLEKHRHSGWRIAATAFFSLTVVGALIGGIQALVQKARGKHPDYLFMTETGSAKEVHKISIPPSIS